MLKKTTWLLNLAAFIYLALVYYYGSIAIVFWSMGWSVAWVVLLHWNADHLKRGLAFVALSVIVAFLGRIMIGSSAPPDVLDMIQNMILLVAGGVGGNFISYSLLNSENNRTKESDRE